MNKADEQTVRALRAIPSVAYGSLSEVLSSVPLRDEQDVASPGQQAQARRTYAKPGLAERAKDVSSPDLIVAELGMNREAERAARRALLPIYAAGARGRAHRRTGWHGD